MADEPPQSQEDRPPVDTLPSASQDPWSSARDQRLAFGVFFPCRFLRHAPLLRVPYFWDEAGYFVPAARDLLLTGSLIPQTTLSNAHPPPGHLLLGLSLEVHA